MGSIKGLDTPAQKAEQFLRDLEREKPRRALHTFIEGSPAERKASSLMSVITRYRKTAAQAGDRIRLELISQEQLGFRMLRLRYLEHHTQRPLLWEFLFYRPENEWHLIKMRFSEDAEEAFHYNRPP